MNGTSAHGYRVAEPTPKVDFPIKPPPNVRGEGACGSGGITGSLRRVELIGVEMAEHRQFVLGRRIGDREVGRDQ
jgi:hypothetical protein